MTVLKTTTDDNEIPGWWKDCHESGYQGRGPLNR